ncbi:restriction endonuclease [Basilea psittacipulmonis]|uniref:restriction endonuclease n=1 Tax=Basilea psittacipulmonis TaxID=1472345 RepID=UPI00068C6A23|nr:DEAD/DEAH box helicase family protein [Basilea psittacipulmonis]
MELKFERLAYQRQAIDSVIRLFQGQSNGQMESFVLVAPNDRTAISNQLELSLQEINKNLNEIQKENKLKETLLASNEVPNFSVEMETGTGKTYVYLRTIIELNLQYGWSRFVIVVPNVAIREGVLQSLRATKSHFETEFNNVIVKHYEYYRDKLSDLNTFKQLTGIQILVMNIGAFNKDENVINRVNEDGEAPIKKISETHPIVIIDEPQNMETDSAKKAIASLNPLFILRYSATHKHDYHKVYSLNPVEAYKQKLVKQVEVHPVSVRNEVNGAYVFLKEIVQGKKKLTAKVELHCLDKDKILKKKVVAVKVGDDLFEKSGGNESYRQGFVVNGLNAESKEIIFSNGEISGAGEQDDVIRDEIMKKQIECTIAEHLKKEARLNPLGIKVLSLFFIDKVAHYRNNGKFFQWFEEIYQRLTGKPAIGVHEGYFSQDKDTNGDSQADEATYNLIMKDKEKLLSFDSPLRFIFSHSALKEGWDNPNVFQICTLNETQSLIKKRQEIGRGLRLAVNQEGQRVYDESINILTVIPNESYESFATNLQREYEEECGIVFENGGAKSSGARKQQTFRVDEKLSPYFSEIWKRISRKTVYAVKFDSAELIKQASEDVKNMPSIQPPQLVIQRAVIHQSQEKGVWGEEKLSYVQNIEHDWNIPDVLYEIQRKTGLTRQTIFNIIKDSGRIGDLKNNPQRFIEQVSERIASKLKDLMVDGVVYLKQETQDEAVYEQNINKWKEMQDKGVEFFENHYTFAIKPDEKVKTVHADYIALDSETEKKFAEDCQSRDDVLLYFKLPRWFKIATPIGDYNPDWALVKKDLNEELKGKQNEELKQVYFIAETKNTGDDKKGITYDKLRMSEQQKVHCAKMCLKEFDNVNYRVVQKVSDLDECVNPENQSENSTFSSLNHNVESQDPD